MVLHTPFDFQTCQYKYFETYCTAFFKIWNGSLNENIAVASWVCVIYWQTYCNQNTELLKSKIAYYLKIIPSAYEI